MSGDCIVRISKLENGFTVSVVDEEIKKRNDDPKVKEWEDPWKEYAFSTAGEVSGYLTGVLDKLEPPADAEKEFGQAFAKAAGSS